MIQDRLLIELSKNSQLSSDYNFCKELASELHTFYIKNEDVLEYKLIKILGKSQLNDKITLMPKQIEMLNFLEKNDFSVLSAPTSFGKSFIVMEHIKRNCMSMSTIIYVVHTKALADEVLSNFSKYFSKAFNVIDSIDDIDPNKNNIIVIISDAYNIYEINHEIDLLIIDEAYNLDKNHSGERFLTIYRSYMKLLKKSKKAILIGPFIKNVICHDKNYQLFKTNYSPVESIITEGEKLLVKDPLNMYMNCILKGENTIGFINSKSKIYNTMYEILKLTTDSNLYHDSFIDWMESYFPSFWLLLDLMKHKIGIYHSSFPKYINLYCMSKFNNGEFLGLLTTSSILEGVNTSAKNIIIFDTNYNNEELTPFQFFNLCGRAGRLNKEIVGKIYNYGSLFCDQYNKKSLTLKIGENNPNPIEKFEIGICDDSNSDIKLLIESKLNEINILFDDWYRLNEYYFLNYKRLLELLDIYNIFKKDFKNALHADLLTKDNKLNKIKLLLYIYENFISKAKSFKYRPVSKYQVIYTINELLISKNGGINFNIKELCENSSLKQMFSNEVSIIDKNIYIVEIMKTAYDYLPHAFYNISYLLNEFIQNDAFFDEQERKDINRYYFERIKKYLNMNVNNLYSFMNQKGYVPTLIKKVKEYVNLNNINIENINSSEMKKLIKIALNNKALEDFEIINMHNING